MSYSYYLIHGLALKAAFMVLGKILPGLQMGGIGYGAAMVLLFGFTLIPAAMLFLGIERPLSLSYRAKAKIED